jgi:hypothetical protein
VSRCTHTPSSGSEPRKVSKVDREFQARKADEKRRVEKTLARLRTLASDDLLTRFAVDSALILPQVETVADWPPHRAPKTLGEMKALEERLKRWLTLKGVGK